MALEVQVPPKIVAPKGDALTVPTFPPSLNYGRAFNLTVSGEGGRLDLSAMRARFSIKLSPMQAPNTLKVRITNLAKTTQEPIRAKEFTRVTLAAGYQGNFGTLFTGDIVQVNLGRESPTDTYCDIFAGDGDKAVNFATVSKTLAAGSTPRDHWNVMLKAMQAVDPNLTEGYVTPGLLDTPKYPRAVTFYGMARYFLRTLAQSKDALWSVQNGALTLVGNQVAQPGNLIVLNSTTGLVGMPTETLNGIMVRCLINPQIRPHTLIQIDQASINRTDISQVYTAVPAQDMVLRSLGTGDGVYRVLGIMWEGDTRGVPWYADLTCIGAKTGSVGGVPSLLAQGYSDT